MALKRKRSSITFSSPSTTMSNISMSSDAMDTSAIPFFYQPTKPLLEQQKPTWAWPTYDDTPSAQHLNSRTRKRHRDDRPDENVVYGASGTWLGGFACLSDLADVCRRAASTIQRLYDAQRQNPHASPILSSPISAPQGFEQRPSSQRSTLYSFWQLPATTAPKMDDMMQVDGGGAAAMRGHEKCEDCDRSLRYADFMDVDAGLLEQEMACGMCRRQVCDTCAVLGDMRVCLACANGR
jgi:hypothetical protein